MTEIFINAVVQPWSGLSADRVIVFADGDIIESGPPENIFTEPRHDRTKTFLSRVLKKN